MTSQHTHIHANIYRRVFTVTAWTSLDHPDEVEVKAGNEVEALQIGKALLPAADDYSVAEEEYG